MTKFVMCVCVLSMISNLAEAGVVDWLCVAAVTVVKVVNVESASWNTDTLSYLIVLFQPTESFSVTVNSQSCSQPTCSWSK